MQLKLIQLIRNDFFNWVTTLKEDIKATSRVQMRKFLERHSFLEDMVSPEISCQSGFTPITAIQFKLEIIRIVGLNLVPQKMCSKNKVSQEIKVNNFQINHSGALS